jgi:hypothetical protein
MLRRSKAKILRKYLFRNECNLARNEKYIPAMNASPQQ